MIHPVPNPNHRTQSHSVFCIWREHSAKYPCRPRTAEVLKLKQEPGFYNIGLQTTWPWCLFFYNLIICNSTSACGFMSEFNVGTGDRIRKCSLPSYLLACFIKESRSREFLVVKLCSILCLFKSLM